VSVLAGVLERNRAKGMFTEHGFSFFRIDVEHESWPFGYLDLSILRGRWLPFQNFPNEILGVNVLNVVSKKLVDFVEIDLVGMHPVPESPSTSKNELPDQT